MQDILLKNKELDINYLDSFIVDLQIRDFSHRTILSYKSHVRYFLKFYTIYADNNDFKDFLILLRDESNLSASTVNNYFCSLSTFFDYLEYIKVIFKNPLTPFRKRYIRHYKQPREEERQLISLEQMKNLIDSAKDLQTKTIFLVFQSTGIRKQELIDLDRSDVFPEKNLIMLKKHHRKRGNRAVFYNEECAFYLEKWIKWRYNHKAKNPALFLGSGAGRIGRDYLGDLVTDHAKASGFHKPKGQLHERFTCHCFRHWFTTWLRRFGCPRELIQELRGDSPKEAIDIYNHISMDELKEAHKKYMPILGIKKE